MWEADKADSEALVGNQKPQWDTAVQCMGLFGFDLLICQSMGLVGFDLLLCPSMGLFGFELVFCQSMGFWRGHQLVETESELIIVPTKSLGTADELI